MVTSSDSVKVGALWRQAISAFDAEPDDADLRGPLLTTKRDSRRIG